MKEQAQYWRWVEIQNAVLVRRYSGEIAFLLAGFEAKRVKDALAAGENDLAEQLKANAERLNEKAIERRVALDDPIGLRKRAIAKYKTQLAAGKRCSESRLRRAVASNRRPLTRTRGAGRPRVRRVVRSSTTTSTGGGSDDTGGGDAPPWWQTRYGHLPPDHQLEVLHSLPEREREAFFSHIAVAVEARRELVAGLRPIGLSVAEYVASLRRRSV